MPPSADAKKKVLEPPPEAETQPESPPPDAKAPAPQQSEVAPEREAAPRETHHELSNWRDPTEPKTATQYYLGVRYRFTLAPQFIFGLFVDEGPALVFLHSGGIELDVRRGNYSVIPHLMYADYGLGDSLFLQKGKDASNPANYSMVASSIKAVYLGVDFLWSTRLTTGLDFEAGLGIGLGALFGDLVNNWVHQDASGTLTTKNGVHYSACNTENDGQGCSRGDHMTTDAAKVGRYIEPTWFKGGGVVPSLYVRLSVPIIGLRIKPMRDLEMRVQTGFALTEGFFFQLSGAFRLPGKS